MSIENEALERARWLIAARTTGIHRHLLDTAIRQLECDAAARGAAPWAELPVAVHLGLRGQAGQAQGLAAVTTLLEAGLTLAGGGMEARQAAASVVRDLAPAGISCLDAPGHRLGAMQDALPDRPFAIPATGREFALYSRLAALLAGASVEVVDLCGRLGSSLGAGLELAGEFEDMFQKPDSSALRRGVRTLPVALHLQALEGPERVRFLQLLEIAVEQAEARDIVRRRLLVAGIANRCRMLIEAHCRRARMDLMALRPIDPGGRQIRELIAAVRQPALNLAS
jgi:hypothetical protein